MESEFDSDSDFDVGAMKWEMGDGDPTSGRNISKGVVFHPDGRSWYVYLLQKVSYGVPC